MAVDKSAWIRAFKSCGWHLSVLSFSKHQLKSKQSEQWFNENKWLGFSIENGI